jgi:hypothetical protein
VTQRVESPVAPNEGANEPPIVGTSSKGEAFRQAIENQSGRCLCPFIRRERFTGGKSYLRKGGVRPKRE